MFKVKKIPFKNPIKLLIVVVMLFSTTLSHTVIGSDIRFRSNRFTQMEEDDATLFNYNDSTDGFTLAASNKDLSLYVDENSLAIKLRNETTGYVWSSTLDTMEDHRLNETWRNFVHSAVTIDYVISDDNSSRESLTSNNSQVDFRLIDQGFQADIEFASSGIQIQLEVRLEDADLVVTVHNDSIYEPTDVRLIAMQLYPFFGATKEGDVPGYMFIPDGAGALIRFGETGIPMTTPFRAMIYGQDYGLGSGTVTTLNQPHVVRMPVYGMVHGINQNAFLTIIESGDHYAELIAYTAGLFTEFNWITPTFHYRQGYFQPTTRDAARGPTISMLQETRNHFDIKMRHRILSDDDANYVGMALSYQERLVELGILTPLEDMGPMMRLEFFGGEMEEGFLWNNIIAMTPIRDIPVFIDRLQAENVNEFLVTYMGWARGGFSNSFPNRSRFERSLGNRSDVNQVVEILAEQNIPLYFHTNFSSVNRGANRLFGGPRIAQQINTRPIGNLLNPRDALSQARSDLTNFSRYGIENLAIWVTTSMLYSTWEHGFEATRTENIAYTYELLELLSEGNINKTALYVPSAPFWSRTRRYFDIPMTASGYLFATDTVPFLHIVLRGYIDYYAPVSNFSANSRAELLRSIEFGAYPSFLLTSEPSHLLADTPSRDIFTSEFDVWEATIVDYYALVVETLGYVRGERIVAREILAPGVVKVSYSNDVQIVVNYTSRTFNHPGITVEAEDFLVIQGGR